MRALTRDVGALREALRQEEKKRERCAAAAKGAEDAKTAAEAQLKQQRYVATKLEQELRTVKERGEAAAAKGRAGLEALRERLSSVEAEVASRSVEAHRHVQRLHSQVQELQAAAMPLAVAAAAAGLPAAGAPPHPALKSPLPGGGGRAAVAAAQRAARGPDQLHRQFGGVLGGLSQLAALLAGAGSSAPSAGTPAVASPAPLLLGDAGAAHVRWADQNSASTANTPTPAANASQGGCSSSGAGAAAGAADADKARLTAEVHRLRAALAEARQRATASEAAAAPVGTADPASSGRVEAAMRQLDAVVPRYRAAAQALQAQAAALRGKLAAAERERAALADEVRLFACLPACLVQVRLGGWQMRMVGGTPLHACAQP